MTWLHTILIYIGLILTFVNIYYVNRENKRLIIIYSFILYILSLVSYKYLGISPLYVVNIVMSFIIYKVTNKMLLTIVIPLSTTLLSIIINITCYYIHFGIFDINIYKNTSVINILMYYTITYLLLFLSARYVKKLLLKNIGNFNVKIKIIFAITLILVITIYLETLRQMKLMEVPHISQVSQNILFILYFITFMTFLLLVSIINNENRLKEINEYNRKLENMTNEMKKFRHDYKNILLSMSGYIQENDMEGLKKLFYCSIEPLSKNINSYNLNITSISNIKNLELKGIILAKLIKAEDLGININISTYGHIDNVNMNTIDLCRVLGIILDNCIEASLECNKPNIDIFIEKKLNYTSFLISNTYINKIDNIADLFKQDISTKGANRGIGLSNLNEILDNYEDVCFSVKLDKYFIQKLDIYG